MGTKVKGLFKGLKHMFDEKEKDIEIGFPTDVKHVGHIGWDGPAANNNSNPSWMKEFNSGPLDSTVPLDASGPLSSKEEQDNPSTEPPSEGSTHKEKSKQRRRSYSAGVPPDSPSTKSGEVRKHSKRQESGDSPKSSDGSKHSRRHRSSAKSMDGIKESSGSCRGTRRSKNSGQGGESPAQDDQLPSIPKHSRARKSKGSSGDASKSKDRNNSEDAFPTDQGSKDTTVQQS